MSFAVSLLDFFEIFILDWQVNVPPINIMHYMAKKIFIIIITESLRSHYYRWWWQESLWKVRCCVRSLRTENKINEK